MQSHHISPEELKFYMQKARVERSLAFYALFDLTGHLVKKLFSEAGRATRSATSNIAGNTKAGTSGMKEC